jgi:hypothetical protein
MTRINHEIPELDGPMNICMCQGWVQGTYKSMRG